MIAARTTTGSTIFERKNAVQTDALTEIIKSNFNCTILAATGVGKTRLLLMAMKALMDATPNYKNDTWLIVYPINDLKDQIIEEAKRWNLWKDYAEHAEFVNISTARKYSGRHIRGLFVDEVHLTLADETDQAARGLYLNNTIDHAVMFTATEPGEEEYRDWLFKRYPVAYNLDVHEARKHKLVSDFLIITIPVTLGPAERAELSRVNYTYGEQVKFLGDGDGEEAFDEARRILKNTKDYDKSEIQSAMMLMQAIGKRKVILHGAKAKHNMTVDLIRIMGQKRFLLFSSTMEQADELRDKINTSDLNIRVESHHSKNKKHLEAFKQKNSQIHGLSTVRVANQGLDVPGVEYLILNAMISKPLEFIQRLGRSIRWTDENKLAIAFIPYIQGSQEAKWIGTSLQAFEVIQVYTVEQAKQRIDEELSKRANKST